MKMARVFLILLILAAIIVLMGGCSTKTETNTDPPASSRSFATDNALAEDLYSNVKEWSDQAMAGATLKSTFTDTVFMGTCVLATLDTTASAWVLTISFGSTNCLCADHKYRRGKILAKFTGPYWYPGTVISYTFDTFFCAAVS